MESNNKEQKFYWIKLKTDFFNQAAIDFMLSQKNGCEYVVLYQMLCLNTANTKGRLETSIGEVLIPYDAEKIARDTKYFDVDTVLVAMELYKKLGLIYEEEDHILKIIEVDKIVGSESKWAEKKRKQRINKVENELLQCNIDVTNCNDKIVDIQKDITRTLSDKSIEYRDKSIEYRDIELNNSVSVSTESLFEFFQQFEINENKYYEIIKYLNEGMELEVIKNALMIPYNRNVMGFDFELEEAPINDPEAYGFAILENWNKFGVKTIEDAKKYNKLKKHITSEK